MCVLYPHNGEASHWPTNNYLCRKKKKERGSDHCESLFWCTLISPLLLFKHEPFLSSALLLPTFFFEPQSLSLICKCWPPLSLSNYFGLRRGISAVVSLLQFPRHLHYSCVFVAVCVRVRARKSEKVETAADENHRADRKKNMTAITTTTPSQISLGTSSDLSFTAKAHLSSRAGIETNVVIFPSLCGGNW